jgi:hypothetical protein
MHFCDGAANGRPQPSLPITAPGELKCKRHRISCGSEMGPLIQAETAECLLAAWGSRSWE